MSDGNEQNIFFSGGVNTDVPFVRCIFVVENVL